jgi:hypothetical protein
MSMSYYHLFWMLMWLNLAATLANFWLLVWCINQGRKDK